MAWVLLFLAAMCEGPYWQTALRSQSRSDDGVRQIDWRTEGVSRRVWQDDYSVLERFPEVAEGVVTYRRNTMDAWMRCNLQDGFGFKGDRTDAHLGWAGPGSCPAGSGRRRQAADEAAAVVGSPQREGGWRYNTIRDLGRQVRPVVCSTAAAAMPCAPRRR